MMNTTVIDRYLTTRILENASWYGNKKMLSTNFALGKYEQSLFYVVSLASMLSLSEGHTVMILSKNQADGWQNLLLPIQEYLSSYSKNEQFLLDFDVIFRHIDENASDQTALKNLINQYLSDFHLAIQDVAGTSRQSIGKNELGDILLHLLRVYYFIKFVLNNDMGELVKFLQSSHLFAHHQTVQVGTPIVFKNSNEALYIWSNRAYHAEQIAMRHIERICGADIAPFGLTDLSDELNIEQKQAVEMVSQKPFAIITGGPGTGKTFTVAQIVLALIGQNPNIDLALSAPTGKAAQRMSESLQNTLQKNAVKISLPEPKTIHRLLGIGQHGVPRYHEKNPLPHDVIIIDEASMLGAELSCHLLSAVKIGARLILLGDAHQLAAVEAGAVLADLCLIPALYAHRVHLVESRRFDADSAVGKLAKLINKTDDVLDELQSVQALVSYYDDLNFINILKNTNYYNELSKGYESYFQHTKSLLSYFDGHSDEKKQVLIKELIESLNKYRILTASHSGMAGDIKINDFLAKYHRQYLKMGLTASQWYHGRVVMVQTNRYDLGLFNGDVGVCLRDDGELVVYFDGDVLRKVSVAMLGGDTVATAYAMTVHKSQGSEFERVAVVFDDTNTRLLSKELIYTAVTRAKKKVDIFATSNGLQLAVTTPTVRTTGLGLL